MHRRDCRKASVIAIVFLCLCSFSTAGKSEPIYHEKAYPAGSGPFPAVIALHTAGGLKFMGDLIQQFVDSGFAVYAPDMFKRHGITARTRGDAFGINSEEIGNELLEIINLMKSDPKVDKNNIFSKENNRINLIKDNMSTEGDVLNRIYYSMDSRYS